MKNDMILFESAYRKISTEFDLSHDVQLKKINGRYVFDKARWMWEAWQAAQQREGYKFVPVDPSDEMYSDLSRQLCR